MTVTYLDTHVAVWLHDGLVGKLTQAARAEIESSNELLISPMVYLELDDWFRRKWVRYAAAKMFANLSGTFGVTMCGYPFAAVVAMAVEVDWTADPFDRVIVAQSRANEGSRLITADEPIRANYERAVW